MKIRISLFAMLFMALPMFSQVHITISDSTWSTSELSSLVGQTVIFDTPIVVSSNASGNYTVGPWRRYQPENQGYAGSAEYSTTVRINNTTTFSLTGISGYHRCGEKIYNLKAKVNSASSLSMIGGTWKGDTRSDLESRLPELGDYRILVCAFNLENYFVKNLGPKYLGPDSYAEHQQQRKKVSKALKRINADIYGLVELEQGNDAIAEIASDLNKNLPGRNYKYFNDGTTGSSQKIDFVYDANVVEPIGTPAETNVELSYRKKMVCFREKATGEKFIFSINHFKSMNTGGADRRENEARAVVKLYNSYRQNANIRENDVLFMGDFNCYAMTDPVFVFLNNGMIDLHRAYHADSSYSYLFGGLASYIDHAISNETLYRQITGMAAYHINSDEDDKYTYDKSRIDFYMEKGKRRSLLEVKGCTLEINGIGYFPDAPTERGVKHLHELKKAAEEGFTAAVAFAIPMPGVRKVLPNDQTQPEFGEALREAEEAGVKVLYLPCIVKMDEVAVDREKASYLNSGFLSKVISEK